LCASFNIATALGIVPLARNIAGYFTAKKARAISAWEDLLKHARMPNIYENSNSRIENLEKNIKILRAKNSWLKIFL